MPEFVTENDLVCALEISGVPKFKLGGVAVSAPVVLVPLPPTPETAMDTVSGVPGPWEDPAANASLPAIVILPLRVPVAVGEKITLKLTL